MSECCICMEEYTPDDLVTDLPCNEAHYFHTKCIADWIKNNNSCPMCRTEITHKAMQDLRNANIADGN